MVAAAKRRKVAPLPPAGRFAYRISVNLTETQLTIPVTILCSDRPYICLGLEGSANKFGAGIISHSPGLNGSTTDVVKVLSNVRHTYVTPPGQGFLPADTARHHQQWALTIIRKAVEDAGIEMKDVDVVAYTKGECEMAKQAAGPS
jgi:hypothetical protein